MDQGTFEEPVEKFLAFFMSPKVHYSFYNGWLLCLSMSPISSIHSLPMDCLKLNFSVTLPFTPWFSMWFVSWFCFQMPATCPVHLFYFVTGIMFGNEYKSWISSYIFLCLLLPSASQVQMSFLASFSWTPSAFILPLVWESKVLHTYKTEGRIYGSV